MLPKGTRLGEHERRLLLEAPAPQTRTRTPILPHGPSASDYAATRRAVAKLERLGLIAVDRQKTYVGSAKVKGLAVTLVDRGMVREDDVRLTYALHRGGKRGWKERVRLRFMRRTALGERVVERHGEALKTGKRIRWDP